MTTIRADNISACDLSKVVIISGTESKKTQRKTSLFSPEELAFQESRRNRKVRKLDFEIR